MPTQGSVVILTDRAMFMLEKRHPKNMELQLRAVMQTFVDHIMVNRYSPHLY